MESQVPPGDADEKSNKRKTEQTYMLDLKTVGQLFCIVYPARFLLPSTTEIQHSLQVTLRKLGATVPKNELQHRSRVNER